MLKLASRSLSDCGALHSGNFTVEHLCTLLTWAVGTVTRKLALVMLFAVPVGFKRWFIMNFNHQGLGLLVYLPS
jgi:hypothetical protein